MNNGFAFCVGETDFEAVLFDHPLLHWRVKVVETSEVLDPGTAGISSKSKPKMQQDIEDLLRRDGDVDVFRRGFKLPPRLERVQELAERIDVEAEYDDEHQTWSCWDASGHEQHHFESESAALLAGIRNSDTLQDFLLTEKPYVRNDDTLMLIQAERWLDNQARRTP